MDAKAYFPLGFFNEIKHMNRLALPIVITQLLQMSFGPMALVFCGRLGPIPLACAALSTSLINVTGVAVVMGLSAACDTLYAQTYGSPNRKNLGVLVQRGALILLLCLMPCFALHLNVERFLITMGQDAIVARLAGEYILITIPGIAAFSVYMTVSKYIQCQDIVVPTMVIGIAANILCGVLHYVLIFVLDMGTNGSAWSITAGYCSLMVLTISYVVISGSFKETWSGFDLDLFREWGQFMKLAYSGMFMLGFEWWSFEVGVFLAGLLGTIEMDALSIVFQIDFLVFILPFGVGFAASIRVGQYLGQGSSDGAKTAARVALIVIAVIGLIVGILIGSLRRVLPRIFSDDENIIERAADVLIVLAFYKLFAGLSAVGGGILRGIGRQLFGSGLIFLVYSIALITGVPTMLLSPLGIKGFWCCLAVSIIGQALVISGVLLSTNWNKEVNKALERTSIAAMVAYETIAEANAQNREDESMVSHGNSPNMHLPEYREKQSFANIPSKEKSHLLENNQNKEKILEIMCVRVITIVAYVLVFVIGIIVRIFVPPDPIDEMLMNQMMLNSTTWNETSNEHGPLHFR